MKSYSYIFLVIFCGISVSCIKFGNRENKRLLEQVNLLVESKPDSVLTLLNAVDTLKLNKDKRAEYNLLRVQARSNAGMDLSSDVGIFETRKYYVNKNDPDKAALSCFYAAIVADAR